MVLPLLLAAQSENESGVAIGLALAIVAIVTLVAGGVMKCQQMMHRPSVNKPSLIALMLGCVGAGLWLALGSFALADVAVPAFHLLGTLVIIVILLAASVLAVVGLCTRAAHHRQGMPQAVTTLVLGPVGLLVCMVQLVVWMSKSQASLVETNSTGGSNSTQPDYKDVSRPELGYETHWASHGWHEWRTRIAPLPGIAQTGVTSGNTVLLICAARFEEDAPDMKSLTRAFERTIDLEYPLPEDDTQIRPWSTPAGMGSEIETEGDRNKTPQRYLLHIVRGRRAAWCVAGWTPKTGGNWAKLCEGIEQVTFVEPQGPVPALPADRGDEWGIFFNFIGLAYHLRSDYDLAIRWFRRASNQAPHDGVLITNWVDALNDAKRYREAAQVLQDHQASFSEDPSFALLQARSLVDTDKFEDGNNLFLQRIEKGLDDEREMLNWIRALSKRKQYALAIKAVDAWSLHHQIPKVQRWKAELLHSSGEHEKARALLESLLKERPGDHANQMALGRLCNDTGDHARAAELAEKALAVDDSDEPALLVLGWSQMGRKWYRDAQKTFERAAKINPNGDAKDALDEASASLGQSNSADFREPIDPVPFPKELEEHLIAEPAPELIKAQSSVLLLRAVGWAREKGKPLRRTLYRRVRILNSDGVSDHGTIDVPFEAGSESLYINRLEVKDPSGKVVAAGNINNAYVSDGEADMGTSHKVLKIPVPGLKPGMVIESEITLQDRGLSSGFEFQRMLWAHSTPCLNEMAFISGEVADIRAETAHDEQMEKTKQEHLLAWTLHNLPAAPQEPMMTQPELRQPMLWLGDREHAEWKDAGLKELADIADRLQSEPEVEELARSLTAHAANAREKAAILSRYVQQETHYKALEFGVRGRRPNAGSETLRLRFGDCKDHALLLHQLLKAAGVESYLALVNSEHLVQPRLPSLDQFNHVVVQVPALGEGWLLDTTDKTLALDQFRAGYLWHSHALILVPGKPYLQEPARPSEGDAALVESHRDITAVGNLWKVNETLRVHGYYASSMRDAFTGLNHRDQLRKAQEIFNDLGNVQIVDFHFENLLDLSQPAEIVMEYLLPNAISHHANLTYSALPALWERYYIRLTYVRERQTPFFIRFPFVFRSDVVVHSVNGLTASSRETLTQHGATPFAAWSLAVENGAAPKGNWKVHFEFQRKPGEFSADRYEACQRAWNDPLEAWQTRLEWAQ